MHFRGGLTVKLLHIVESQIVTFFYHNIDVHFIRYVVPILVIHLGSVQSHCSVRIGRFSSFELVQTLVGMISLFRRAH